ncbi:DUF624 domain-containing protein [Lacticaseibacillus parakribbianus]|uniref:DUF624 domain-containing protein n=1 Tax=Lacticaseibacillus parakribbianus TaxID=2970927 RepID=UPI0021CB8AFE|nr:DUF624 domain-containing protein [Lacticaseibacillus parakribbianus]
MAAFVYRFCSYYLNLLVLNVLTLVGILAGGVVLGFFPAILSAMSLYRKFHRDFDSYFKFRFMVKLYVERYRANFWSANLLGLQVLGIAALLYLEFRMTTLLSDPVTVFFRYVLDVVIVISVISFQTLLALYAYFDLPKSRYILQAYLVTLTSPVQLAAILAFLVGFYVVFRFLPAFLLPVFITAQLAGTFHILHKRFRHLAELSKQVSPAA